MKSNYLAICLVILIGLLPFYAAFGHQNPCHSRHSCPSDRGTYVCGDKGDFSQCTHKHTIPSSMALSGENKIQSASFTGVVKKIIDGDTLHIGSYKVRLALTNTPEKNQPGYKQATTFTKSLCPVGSFAKVNQDDGQPFDKYGRLVGKVYCSGKLLNSELLSNNHATISKQFCKKSEFGKEEWAKKYGC